MKELSKIITLILSVSSENIFCKKSSHENFSKLYAAFTGSIKKHHIILMTMAPHWYPLYEY